MRRDVGIELSGIQQLLSLGFQVDESGEELLLLGDKAISFWTEGIGSLPEEWDRFIPDDLVDVTIRHAPVAASLVQMAKFRNRLCTSTGRWTTLKSIA